MVNRPRKIEFSCKAIWHTTQRCRKREFLSEFAIRPRIKHFLFKMIFYWVKYIFNDKKTLIYTIKFNIINILIWSDPNSITGSKGDHIYSR